MQPDSPYQPPASYEPMVTRQPYGNTDPSLKEVLFSFRGRIPRRTFWLWSILASLGFMIPIGLLAPLVQDEGTGQWIGGILMVPFVIAFIWSALAIRVKRWHDHGKSGFWILIGMIPYIGALISFIFLGCLRGTVGDNAYGGDPT